MELARRRFRVAPQKVCKRSAEAVQVGRKFHGMRASSSRLDHPLVMRSRVSLSVSGQPTPCSRVRR
jgi:hypothetical protein